MKILLLGEFSGLHNNLKDGLEELGHNVLLAADGDGFKNFQSDIRLGMNIKNKRLYQISRLALFYKNLYRHYNRYDVVQLTNPFVFFNSSRFSIDMFNKLKNLNEKLFVTTAGQEPVTVGFSKKLRYSPYNNLYAKSNYPIYKKSQLDIQNRLLELVDGVIPVMYEYAQGYREIGYTKLSETIPLPISTKKIGYKENVINEKIVIFHGVTREIHKGTPIIREALNNIKEKYPNDVEVIIAGKMPIDKYLQIVNRSNIIVDQCTSYGYGMSALYSMAQGKVVLSGCEPETTKDFKLDDCPVINIKPEVEQIQQVIEELISTRSLIPEMGFQSRRFVEEFHDSVNVAEKYLNVWKSM